MNEMYRGEYERQTDEEKKKKEEREKLKNAQGVIKKSVLFDPAEHIKNTAVMKPLAQPKKEKTPAELIHERNVKNEAEYSAAPYDPKYDTYVQQGKAAAGNYNKLTRTIVRDSYTDLMAPGARGTYKSAADFNDEQKNTYYYYYGKEGKKAANDYLDGLMAIENEKSAAAETEKTKESARRHNAATNLLLQQKDNLMSLTALPAGVIDTVKNTDWENMTPLEIGRFALSTVGKAQKIADGPQAIAEELTQRKSPISAGKDLLKEKIADIVPDALSKVNVISDDESKLIKEAVHSLIGTKKEDIELPTKGPIDLNSPAYSGIRRVNARQEAATENMGELGKGAYGFAANLENNIITPAMFGELAPLVMSLQAGGNEFYNKVQGGAVSWKSLKSGVANAVNEWAGEQVGIEQLKKIIKSNEGVRGVKAIAKTLFSNGGNEYVNEAATSALNILSDFSIMGDEAEFKKYYDERINNGDDKLRAGFYTALAAMWQINKDGVMGFLSGMALGGGAVAINRGSQAAMDRAEMKSIDEHAKFEAAHAEPRVRQVDAKFPELNFTTALPGETHNYTQNAPQTTDISGNVVKQSDQTANKAAVNDVARAIGAKVKTAEQTKGTAAKGKYDRGAVYLTGNDESPTKTVLAHKMMSHLKENAPETYDAYVKMARDTLSTETGLSRIELWWRKKAQYAEQGIELSVANAEDELVSDFNMRILTDPSELTEAIRNAKELNELQKVILVLRTKNAIKHMADQLESYSRIAGIGIAPSEVADLRNTQKQLERIVAEKAWNSESLAGTADSGIYSAPEGAGDTYAMDSAAREVQVGGAPKLSEPLTDMEAVVAPRRSVTGNGVDNGGRSGIINGSVPSLNIQLFAETDIKRQESSSLKRAIRKYERNIQKHEDTIINPEKYYPHWNEFTPQYQAGLRRHWKKEINNFKTNIKTRIDELKKRGDYDD